MAVIPVSDELWQELNKLKEHGDTFEDVLRRELKLPKKSKK